MDAPVPFSNFNFLKPLNPELFTKIQSAESKARTDCRNCAQLTRQALETFINCVLRAKGLQVLLSESLDEKVKRLRDVVFLRDSGVFAPGARIKRDSILPDLGSVNYLTYGGNERNEDAYDFLRHFGNTASHPEQQPYYPALDFKNSVLCLKKYWELFYQYYASRLPQDREPFREEQLPIDKYYAIRSLVPKDRSRSKCDREFWGFCLDARGNISYYAILRQYEKQNVDGNFLLRNADVFLQASRETVSGIPEGMASFQTVTEYGDPASPFYITAHLFRNPPEPLSQALLSAASPRQRIALCAAIAACFRNLHQAEEPIYHRLLSYDSIVVCRIREQLVPYVTKFDFGKLPDSDQYQTVFVQAKQAENLIKREKSLTKYLAPEWSRITGGGAVDWEKIDLYSLGVLFSDILAGTFGPALVPLEELEDLGYSDDLIDVIDEMTMERSQDRCPLELALMALEEEKKRWS